MKSATQTPTMNPPMISGNRVSLNLFNIGCVNAADLCLKSVESVCQSADGESDLESVKHNDKRKNAAGGKNIGVKTAV